MTSLPATIPTERIGGRRVTRCGPLSVVWYRRTAVVTVALCLVAAGLALAGIVIGTLPIGIGTVWDALRGHPVDGPAGTVVRNIRIPRALTAIAAGAALGVSGSVFQSVSRNALGSPDVIGFTTGAATGAIVQIVVFGGNGVQVAISAVVGGLATAVAVYLFARRDGVSGGYRLVLVGIGIGAVLAAANGLLLVTGDLDNAISANLWLSGSLQARTWQHTVPVLAALAVLVPAVGWLARRAAMMQMGDDLAQQLGVPVERTRVLLMVAAVVLAGVATGATGPIAFVALAAPQIVIRLTRGTGLPVLSAAAMGAVLLIGADVITRLLPVTAAMPIGRMTGILGGLYLMWLITRTRDI